MRIVIDGEPKEIAALIKIIQENKGTIPVKVLPGKDFV